MTKTNSLKPKASSQAHSPKRVALYARVSTQEQTKGQFPSCDSQIEELEAFAASKGWEVAEAIKDEGHRAGTLQRPGLALLRHLVASGQIEVVVCTWYNRLIGSRDFYVLDKEFKANNVEFMTVHDPADRNTASGRLLESMLVTIKTFENEQIGEKVQTKMRQRAEKGLWNGGFPPFAFSRDFEHKTIVPDLEKAKIVEQMFRIYVETRSEFKVRDWLKARQIPTSTGKPEWAVSTVRDALMNRLYIGEIEINRRNKGLVDVPEPESYRIAKAPFEPLVPVELFETAQAVRKEKAQASPNRVGRPVGFIRCRVCSPADAAAMQWRRGMCITRPARTAARTRLSTITSVPRR
jgi:DNA invertase Pin-like site-specific DNA recombinase